MLGEELLEYDVVARWNGAQLFYGRITARLDPCSGIHDDLIDELLHPGYAILGSSRAVFGIEKLHILVTDLTVHGLAAKCISSGVGLGS